MKPTPGPYKIDDKRPDVIRVRGMLGEIVAAFPLGPGIDMEQARANAESWIAGVVAVQKLEALKKLLNSALDDRVTLSIVRRTVLDEP